MKYYLKIICIFFIIILYGCNGKENNKIINKIYWNKNIKKDELNQEYKNMVFADFVVEDNIKSYTIYLWIYDTELNKWVREDLIVNKSVNNKGTIGIDIKNGCITICTDSNCLSDIITYKNDLIYRKDKASKGFYMYNISSITEYVDIDVNKENLLWGFVNLKKSNFETSIFDNFKESKNISSGFLVFVSFKDK